MIIIIKIIIKSKDNNANNKKRLALLHFGHYVLTIILVPRKVIRQIFWLPKHTLYLHQGLNSEYHKESLNNFIFVLVNN